MLIINLVGTRMIRGVTISNERKQLRMLKLTRVGHSLLINTSSILW
jgi:hypothetical protein